MKNVYNLTRMNYTLNNHFQNQYEYYFNIGNHKAMKCLLGPLSKNITLMDPVWAYSCRY